MSSKIKVYELAKELGQDSQHLVDVIQRLGIDIKNPMSVLGSEEVRNIREYYRKQRPLTKATTPAPSNKPPVTEKRVGATVIRRRAKAADKPEAPIIERIPHETEPEPEFTEVEVETAPPVAPVEAEAAPETSGEIVAEESEATLELSTGAEAPVAEPPPPPPPPQESFRRTTPLLPRRPKSKTPLVEGKDKAPEVTAKTPPAPAAPEAPTPPPAQGATAGPEKKRRFFPSIIKKVATEQYLGEKIGPKPIPRPEDKKPATTGTRPAGSTAATDDKNKLLPKRVKEVELVQTEAQKESKRRVMERQTSVFKSADYLKRELVHSTKKKKTVINRPAMKTQLTTAAQHKRTVEMGDTITVAELAKEMGIKAGALIGKLMGMGVSATMNEKVDHDTATLVAHEFGYEVKQKVFREENFLAAIDVTSENTLPRAPVVTIMGHVDHGKTSLLDAIRKTKVAAGEAGGITQHVGAYTVKTPKGKIAFIDTPGHEAFTAMRARGAKVTDIVVVVVSAVDGVMPQTMESISHAQAGGVPIIVAVNKIDLPDGNPDRIKQTLAGQGLNPEEWGGDTIYVNVSAKTGQGLDQLLESILLQAEVLELKANYDVPARGVVVESKLDKSRGPVATVLIQHGKLHPGEIIVCGTTFGKIRAMNNWAGERMKEAEPSDPVEVLGLTEVPNAGDTIAVVADEKAARELAGARIDTIRQKAHESRPKMTLDEIMKSQTGGDRELKVILKTDVQGSTEALKEAMYKFPQDRVKLKVLLTATGGITESDVMLAAASQAVVLGFNVRPDVKAQKLADAEGVQVKSYSIIYELLDDVKKFLEGLLEIEHKEKVIGRAEVRSVFNIPKIGTIAGSAVIDGKVIRGCYLRLLRDSRVVYEGKISSLKRFKEDVREVMQGFECGIGLENFSDLKMGDQFEAFVKEEVKGVL
jgi:translation initiation factor IF-2